MVMVPFSSSSRYDERQYEARHIGRAARRRDGVSRAEPRSWRDDHETRGRGREAVQRAQRYASLTTTVTSASSTVLTREIFFTMGATPRIRKERGPEKKFLSLPSIFLAVY